MTNLLMFNVKFKQDIFTTHGPNLKRAYAFRKYTTMPECGILVHVSVLAKGHMQFGDILTKPRSVYFSFGFITQPLIHFTNVR